MLLVIAAALALVSVLLVISNQRLTLSTSGCAGLPQLQRTLDKERLAV